MCFMKTKGWLPGQTPGAGGGPQAWSAGSSLPALSPSTVRLSKEPSGCRVPAGRPRAAGAVWLWILEQDAGEEVRSRPA